MIRLFNCSLLNNRFGYSTCKVSPTQNFKFLVSTSLAPLLALCLNNEFGIKCRTIAMHARSTGIYSLDVIARTPVCPTVLSFVPPLHLHTTIDSAFIILPPTGFSSHITVIS